MEAETFHLYLSIKVKINLENKKKKKKLCLLPKTPKGHLKAALFVKKFAQFFSPMGGNKMYHSLLKLLKTMICNYFLVGTILKI